jgi:hypothetical protein
MDHRTCPTGCGRSVRAGQLLCPACWRKVPGHLQGPVYAAWRAFQRDSSDANWDAYIEARDNAIGAVP